MVKQLIGSLLLIASSNALMAAPFAYIPQPQNDRVSVFDLSTDTARSPTARNDGEQPKIKALSVQHNPIAAVPNLAGTLVYVVNHDSDSITVIDSSKIAVLNSFHVGSKPIAAAVTYNDKKLYVANEGDNTLQVIDINNNSITKTISLDARPSQLRMTTSGRLYVMSKEGKYVKALDTQTDTWLFTINTNEQIDTPKSSTPIAIADLTDIVLLIGSEDGDIYTWNVKDPKKIEQTGKIVLKRDSNDVKRAITALDSFQQTMYVGLNDGDILVIGSGATSADYQSTISTNTTPTGLNISNDLKTIAITNSKSSSVALIATLNNKVSYIDVGGTSAANGKFISAPSFQFSIPAYAREEDNNSFAWNVATVQIKRVGNIAGVAKVHYQTESGTAFTKWDFLETKGDLEFQDGEDAKEITIQIVGDTTVEDNETFTVKLSTPGDGYNIGPQGSTEITLVNDDSLPTGAGCTIGSNSQNLDPSLPILVSGALTWLIARRRRKI